MKQVKDILKIKGPEVVTVHDEKTVYDAVSILVKNRIGGLLVLEQSGKIAGIITERDILNESFRDLEGLRKNLVKDVMTRDVIIGTPDDDLDAVENLMTEKRIRHLPILENKRLVGIISIGDVVKAQKKAHSFENRFLKEYIEGKYPG